VSTHTGDQHAPAVQADGDAVRVLTLDRPARLNAIDEELHRALLAALREATAHRDTRAIVLTGSGPCFSAGGDLDLIRAMGADVRVRREILGQGREIFHHLTTTAIPVIAAVNGPAVGAGCTLALLCDIVVMADDAHLADPHVALGLVPGDGGAVLWPLVAGLAAARAYLLTGDRLPAPDAHRLGLVHRIVPRPEVLTVATELAERIAALPAYAVQETKRCLNAHVASAASAVFEQALGAEHRSFDTDEHAGAVEAMAQRRRGSEHT
jgi:enoyl-CoA hydratase/carnithine racemase